MAAKAAAPKCAKCGKPVHERAIIAEGKVWHYYHFQCIKCNKQLPSAEYCSHDGNIYCKECHKVVMAVPCAKCGKEVKGQCYEIDVGQRYHPECLSCATCQAAMPDGTCYPHKGKVYCLAHFHEGSSELNNL